MTSDEQWLKAHGIVPSVIETPKKQRYRTREQLIIRLRWQRDCAIWAAALAVAVLIGWVGGYR